MRDQGSVARAAVVDFGAAATTAGADAAGAGASAAPGGSGPLSGAMRRVVRGAGRAGSGRISTACVSVAVGAGCTAAGVADVAEAPSDPLALLPVAAGGAATSFGVRRVLGGVASGGNDDITLSSASRVALLVNAASGCRKRTMAKAITATTTHAATSATARPVRLGSAAYAGCAASAVGDAARACGAATVSLVARGCQGAGSDSRATEPPVIGSACAAFAA
jgi:hypothetical protein